MKITPNVAHDILQRCSIAVSENFYSLDSTRVMALVGEADAVRYRAPKNANGSRGRYFYALLQRRVARINKD